jgi:hypothetical protein
MPPKTKKMNAIGERMPWAERAKSDGSWESDRVSAMAGGQDAT